MKDNPRTFKVVVPSKVIKTLSLRHINHASLYRRINITNPNHSVTTEADQIANHPLDFVSLKYL